MKNIKEIRQEAIEDDIKFEKFTIKEILKEITYKIQNKFRDNPIADFTVIRNRYNDYRDLELEPLFHNEKLFKATQDELAKCDITMEKVDVKTRKFFIFSKIETTIVVSWQNNK